VFLGQEGDGVVTAGTGYPHITRDADGVLRVGGHGLKLILLVAEHRYRGMTAAEMVAAFSSLTLGEVHSALAYYYDHQAVLDADLARRIARTDELRADLEDPDLARRLREGYTRWRATRA
jgi:uncharacterized protein (DUF433 family)